MKPLTLEVPLPSTQISDKRMRKMTRLFAELLTEETAELLDRLADFAYIAGNSCSGYSGEEDEEAAYTLATKIRELLNE